MLIVQPETYTYEICLKHTEKLIKTYSFLRRVPIGKSVGGKELFVLLWGTGEKKIFINAAHHGMEWITSLLLMQMLETCCLHYAERTTVGETDFYELFSKVTLAVCPMVNPDGVNLATCGLAETLPAITKTRLKSYNGGSTDFSKWQANLNGIDLNHNYDAGFYKGVFMQHKLGIYSPGPTRFSGSEPESEPETKALVQFTRSFHPDIALAYHTQGEVIYYDYESKATQKAKELAQKLAEVSGYQLDETDGMASFSGYKDWVIEVFGIPAFTIEAGLGENPLPLNQIDKIYSENFPILLYVLRT